jgi:hypothetical protein
MTSQACLRPPLWLTCLACALLSGCGGPKVAPVRGKVTYDGKPVTGGKIMFYPESGRMAIGEIGADGTYTLTTFHSGDGALVGPHRVAIESTSVGPGTMQSPKSIEEEIELSKKGAPGGKILVAGKVEWLVPQKYSLPETSGLTAKVGSGPNEINFDIPAENR